MVFHNRYKMIARQLKRERREADSPEPQSAALGSGTCEAEEERSRAGIMELAASEGRGVLCTLITELPGQVIEGCETLQECIKEYVARLQQSMLRRLLYQWFRGSVFDQGTWRRRSSVVERSGPCVKCGEERYLPNWGACPKCMDISDRERYWIEVRCTRVHWALLQLLPGHGVELEWPDPPPGMGPGANMEWFT